MSTPRAFVGESSGNGVFLVDDGHQDNGLAVELLAEPLPVAPGGSDGEAIFHNIRVAITHTMATTVNVTPIIDGVAKAAIPIVLEAKAARTTEIFELSLMEPYVDPVTGAEEMRVAMRGTTFTARVEAVLATGYIAIDHMILEAEIVSESRSATNES